MTTAFVSSCNKEILLTANPVFIKTISTNSLYSPIQSFETTDSGFVVFVADKKNFGLNRLPGKIIKVDKFGNQLWSKSIASHTKTLFHVVEIPGDGYATIGWDDPLQTILYATHYDADGNFISEKTVSMPFSNSWVGPYTFIRLQNGNYAICGGSFFSVFKGILKIIGPDFSNITYKTFSAPSGFRETYISGISQSNDGSINMMASVQNLTINKQNNLLYIKTDESGNQLKYTFKNDSSFYETVNCMATTSTGSFAIAGSMQSAGLEGTYLDYNNNNNALAALISGQITLELIDTAGNFIERKIISGYNNNGIIQSTHTTRDGGYILCGTVNQANSAVIVSQTKIFIVKLNASLNIEWTKTINTTYPAYGMDAFETKDNGFLITGMEKSMNQNFEPILIKTDSEGNY